MRKAPRVALTCSNCGVEYERPEYLAQPTKSGEHFCCTQCRRAWQTNRRIKAPCAHCGKQVEKRASDLRGKTGDKLFCDMDCFRAWEATTKMNVHCAECGKEFERYKHHAEKQEHQFCSTRCQGAWFGRMRTGEKHPTWRDDLMVVCDQCGTEFRQHSKAKIERNNYNFCTRKCKETWSSIHQTGENNPNWRGGHADYYGPNWHRQARAARKRDGYRCQCCGITQKNGRRSFDVHHIVPFRTFGYIRDKNNNYEQANDLSNLITLCQQCHAKAEAKLIPIQPTLL